MVLKRRRRRSRGEPAAEPSPEPAAEAGALAATALEQSLELALEAGGMGSWSWDPATGVAHWSESMERLCGLEPGTFSGSAEDAIALVHPDDRELVSQRVAASIAGDEPQGMQYRVVRPDGTVRWIDNRSRKLPDGTWVGIAIDITEQRQVEDELRNREAEARLALDAGRMGSWRWERDTDEVFWSSELEAVFGFDRGTFAGTFKAYIDRIAEEDRAQVLAAIGGAIDTGEEVAFEHRIVRPDGRVRWLECRGQAVPDTNNMQWIGVAIDVTDRKETETERARLLALEHLARAEAEELTGELEATVSRLDTLLEHAPVGFGFYDTDFRYVRVNGPLAEMNGLPRDDHMGHTVKELFPHLWESVGPLFEQVVETGEAVIDREVSAQTPAVPGVVRHWIRSIYPVKGRGGELVGVGSVVVEITERKRAEMATQLLAKASELFVSDRDLDQMIDRAVRLAIPDFADSCHLYLVEPDGRGQRVAMANVDPELEPLLLDADRRYPADLDSDLPTAAALRTGQTHRVEVVTAEMRAALARDPEHRELLERHGVCSVIATPIVARGERLGVLILTYTEASNRRYQPDDERLAQELALRFAEAIDRARLFEDAQRARANLDLLARVGELVTVELDSRARLEALPELVLPAFADICVVHVTEPDGSLRVASFGTANALNHVQLEAKDLDAVDVDGEPTPWRRAVMDGRAVTAGDFRAGRLSLRSILSVPLPGPTGAIGAVTFAHAESGRRYRPEDVLLAEELGRRVAPAVEHAFRFEQERSTVEMLQRSLLPERLPDLPEAERAARYVPGTEHLEIGGDWYDVVALPDGQVLVAIGDVVGHGVRAATSMGKIRNSLQFLARDGLSPGPILRRLNEYFLESEDGDMATLLVLQYDPQRELLRFASAGHPPPLVHQPTRAPAYLPGGRGAPLCASDHTDYPEMEAPLPTGSVLLLYTDGLIERRGESLDVGLERLATALANGPQKMEGLVDHVLTELLGDDAAGDDVALLALRALGAAAGLDLRLPARPRELSVLRYRVREWLADVGAAPTEAGEITLAVNEAASNAVEHAYGLSDADFSVDGRIEDESVVVRISDGGRWRDPPAHDRGRGLDLMRGLMDDATVESGLDGTTVVLRRRLRGEVSDE